MIKLINKIFAKLELFLLSHTNHSSLRLGVLITIFTGNFCTLLMFIALLIRAIQGIAIDWIGASAMVVSLSTFIGVALWGKNASKNKESDD